MNIKGNKKDTVYSLMGSMKVPEGSKLDVGVRTTTSKTFQATIAQMGDRVGITWQKDNRGLAMGERDTHPYLQTNRFKTKDGKDGISNMAFFSNKVGVQRGEDGKPITGADGKPVLKDGKSQVARIFDAVPSVEVVETEHGKFMHFAAKAPVMVTKDGLLPDIGKMEGVKAEAGMGSAQFTATKEARSYAKENEGKGAADKGASDIEAKAAEIEAAKEETADLQMG